MAILANLIIKDLTWFLLPCCAGKSFAEMTFDLVLPFVEKTALNTCNY